MKLSIVAGATSQSVNVFLRDSSSATGGGLTGLVFNTASLTAYYTFAGANATATAITLATLAAVNSAFSSGGFKEIDATNMPGWYRFDIPNAALATSKGRSVAIHFKGATNLAPTPVEIELTGWDNQDAVRGGLTALPNVASGSAGALLVDGTGTAAISNSAGKVLLQATQAGVTIPTVTTVTNRVTANADQLAGQTVTAAAGVTFPTSVASPTNITAGTITTVTTLTNLPSIPANWLTAAGITAGALNGKGDWLLSGSYTAPTNLTAAQIATGVWQDATAGDFTTAGSIGKSLYTAGVVPGGASGIAIVGSNVTFAGGTDFSSTMKTSLNAATPAGVVGAVGSVTGNVGGNVVGSVGSVAGITFPANFSALSVNAGDGGVNVHSWHGTAVALSGAFNPLVDVNLDSTGVALVNTAGLPTRFSSLAISVAGATTVGTNNDKTGYDLVNAPNATAVTAIANGLLDLAGAIDPTGGGGADTLRKAVRLVLAACAGQVSGAAGTSIVIKDTTAAKSRLTATVDANGNRTAVSYDAT